MRRKEGVVNRHHFNKNAFFDFFLRRLSTHPTPGSPHIPQRWRPKPQRTRTDCTAQAAGQAVPKPGRERYQGKPYTGTHARTLDTLHRSALDTRDHSRRADRTGGGRWRADSVSGKLHFFGCKIFSMQTCISVACAT